MHKIDPERLNAQLAFFREADKLKSIFRQTRILDNSRFENDAEHSWHLAMMVLTFKEYAVTPDLDVGKVLKLVILHDVVEIDAGDVYTYSHFDPQEKYNKELAAAIRIFGLLPTDLEQEMLSLWHEYEDKKTPESLFATTIDKLQPFLHNYYVDHASWRLHDVPKHRVLEKMSVIEKGAPALWEYVKALVEEADRDGLFADSLSRQFQIAQ
jgi:putative hydrolase of HD superfamily